jgi:hypothetical protein
MKRFITMCLLIPCLLAKAQDRDTGIVHKPEIIIEQLSPTFDRPPGNARPEFKWNVNTPVEGISFLLIVREVEKNNINEGKIILRQEGIRKTAFKYPDTLPPLDTAKVYAWFITAYDNNGEAISKQFGVPIVVIIPKLCIGPFIAISSDKICFGNAFTISYWLFGGSGPLSWTLSAGAGSIPQSGTGTFLTITPATIGAHNYVLTVTRGSCVRQASFTVYVYPTISINKSNICNGEDAVLTLLPGGYPVTWEWSDGGVWQTLGSTNPQNTNPINISPGSCPSAVRKFRAVVSGLNLPDPPPCAQLTTQLTVWCKTVAGTITVNPGKNICSNNNYPVTINLTLSGNTGSVVSWNGVNVTATGPLTATATITTAGDYTYSAVVRNGPATGGCGVQTTSVVVHVEDPIKATVTGTKTEVCPNDDATLTLAQTGGTPGANTIQWEYDVNCTNNWTPAGTGPSQNTNSIGNAGPYNPFPVTSICWRAIVSSPTQACPPTTSNTWKIDIIQPPCVPTIALASGSLPKCPGTAVQLQASTACGTGPFIYKWYLDGEYYGTGQQVSVTNPGNYTVEVFNKNNCQSRTSAVYPVVDCENLVTIEGPCTSNGHTPIKLTAVSNPNVAECNGPYTYQWFRGNTPIANTQSITVTPASTTVYTVIVTNSSGCTVKVSFSVKVCKPFIFENQPKTNTHVQQ